MIDEQPPQDLDAERALLGAVLITPAALDDTDDLVTAADFYRPGHGWVWAAVLAVRDAGTRPDPISVAAELDRRGQLLRVGGLPYLHTLMQSVPTASV